MSTIELPTAPMPIIVTPRSVSHHDPIFYLDLDGTIAPDLLDPAVHATLANSSFEIIWVTRALHDARQWLSPSLGLPPTTPTLSGFTGDQNKLAPLRTRATGRRFAWLSTEAPALLVTADQLTVPLDPRTGLTPELAQAAVGWAAARSWRTPSPSGADARSARIPAEAH
jgi:hypothetical protein